MFITRYSLGRYYAFLTMTLNLHNIPCVKFITNSNGNNNLYMKPELTMFFISKSNIGVKCFFNRKKIRTRILHFSFHWTWTCQNDFALHSWHAHWWLLIIERCKNFQCFSMRKIRTGQYCTDRPTNRRTDRLTDRQCYPYIPLNIVCRGYKYMNNHKKYILYS